MILFDKLDKVFDEIAPIKEICIKNNTKDWFDEEIYQGIKARDKLFKKFKRSRLHTDNIKFKNARNRLQVDYYKDFHINDKNFNINQTTVPVISKFLEEINPNKAVGIDNLAGKFLKDTSDIIAEPTMRVILCWPGVKNAKR